MYTTCCAFWLSTLYGPEPTGCMFVYSMILGLDFSSSVQMWAGRILVWLRAVLVMPGLVRSGLSANVTVCASVLVTLARYSHAEEKYTSLTRLPRSKVYTTSSAVTGLPSCHLASGCSFTTIVFGSGWVSEAAR